MNNLPTTEYKKLDVDKPLSVSQFIGILNESLKKIQAEITGEISKVSFAQSGHVYFDLKDEEDESVLHCVIWKSYYETLGIKLEKGMKIVAAGYADIYALNGELRFKARAIELVGEGILKKRYDELKKKLGNEGLFDVSRKRPIPEYPRTIGIVTSRSGAIIQDILNNLGRFGFKVKLIDARVEGPEAVQSLIRAVRQFRKVPIDVLVIARGGGSIEALQAFDNEFLVREIVRFPKPVIAGIGHHQDVPLVALVADVHESTPTAVATLLSLSWQRAVFGIQNAGQRIIDIYRNLLYGAADALEISVYVKAFMRVTTKANDALDELKESILSLFDAMFSKVRERIDMFERIIRANDPGKNLKIGYTIVRQKGRVVRSVKQVRKGAELDLRVSDGIILTEVSNIVNEDG